MGRKKWRRIRLADLADKETQKELLGLISRVNRPGEAESPETKAPEIATTGRSGEDPTLTPHQESTT